MPLRLAIHIHSPVQIYECLNCGEIINSVDSFRQHQRECISKYNRKYEIVVLFPVFVNFRSHWYSLYTPIHAQSRAYPLSLLQWVSTGEWQKSYFLLHPQRYAKPMNTDFTLCARQNYMVYLFPTGKSQGQGLFTPVPKLGWICSCRFIHGGL